MQMEIHENLHKSAWIRAFDMMAGSWSRDWAAIPNEAQGGSSTNPASEHGW